ncbi:catalase [Sporomusa sp.]|uniref:catalase n=1 Tax=Sporomusa sp. TaxID=2078658 RepID=UPI002BD0F358|nr:catalase [Sporomusa sp.]HWR08435.1 catalase [Sporomusa sp.]
MSDKEQKVLTTNLGNPVFHDQDSITTENPRYTLLSDTHLIEKLAHFDRERIPERVVHAKGTGAHGYFEVTHDITKYTRAAFLAEIGKKTDLFLRFSTVGGEKGSADSSRDPRGFSIKFYTQEGNYDMVGNNTPIFFIRDAIKFPDFIHTQKRHPAKHTKDPDMMWDFLSLTPESIHQVTILFSDRGTPKTFRHMDGHSSHTFMFYNQEGEHYWFKWHFKADLGFQTLTEAEATDLAGKDPDSATRDLFDSIEKGDYPSWTVSVQIMPSEDAATYKFDPFDVTKVWYHADYPLIPVGKMVLNRNPDNFFAEVEQVAFSPGNFVPGIAVSPDRMLQGRLFSYPDAHRHRLGPNFHQIPINRPKAASANTYQRDGFMTVDDNGGSGPNYYPNTFDGPAPDPAYAPPVVPVSGTVARHEYPLADVDFVQAGELYRRVMSNIDRDHLIQNICGNLGQAQKRIQLRQAALFYKADADYGRRVAETLGLDVATVQKLAAMSQEERVKATLA